MKKDSERDVVEASELLSDLAIRFFCRVWRFPDGCYLTAGELGQLLGRSSRTIERLRSGLKELKLLATEGRKEKRDIWVTTFPIDFRFTPRDRFATGYECQAAGKRFDLYLGSILTAKRALFLQSQGVLNSTGVRKYFAISGGPEDGDPPSHLTGHPPPHVTPMLPLMTATSGGTLPEARPPHEAGQGEGGKGGELSSSQSVKHSVRGSSEISPTTDRIARDPETTDDRRPGESPGELYWHRRLTGS